MEYRFMDTGTQYWCKYHILWVTKYNRRIFNTEHLALIKQIAYEEAAKKSVQIINIITNSNTVYLEVLSPPAHSIQSLVASIKRASSGSLKSKYPSLRTRIPTIWTRAYFVSTEDTYPAEQIESFISHQPKYTR